MILEDHEKKKQHYDQKLEKATHNKVFAKEEVLEFIGLWKQWRHCGNLIDFRISNSSGKYIIGNKIDIGKI